MAIDTAKKRTAATPGTLPSPDGTIDAGDRAQVVGVYQQFSDTTPDTGTVLFLLTGGKLTVDVKTVKDRGSSTSSATVPVTVTFNKTFADVISIDVFPISNSSQRIYRVIDFVDAPDPVSFDVTFFSNTGTQLALDFGWTVEGVLKYT